MKSLFRFSLIFFLKNFGMHCSGVFIKVNSFICSLDEIGNEWLNIPGFVIDNFHFDCRSFIKNTHGVTSLVVYGFEDLGDKVF